jgi:hypothetical protein
VAEAEGELEVGTLGLHAVTGADDLQGLLVTLGDARTMLAIRVRVSPCRRARQALVVGTGDLDAPLSPLATVMGSATTRANCPLGPLTVTVWPSMSTVTPAGTTTGRLPIRDMSSSPYQT